MAIVACLGLLLVFPSHTLADQPGPAPIPNTPIKHFLVLMQENHTFDNYFGTYPGADGVSPGTCMPVNPFDATNKKCEAPFHLGDRAIGDLDHSTGTYTIQYNNGRMDGFVYALTLKNQDGATAMGYYDDRDLPYYWNVADAYVLFDRFFSSAKAGSFLNHIFCVSHVTHPSQRHAMKIGHAAAHQACQFVNLFVIDVDRPAFHTIDICYCRCHR